MLLRKLSALLCSLVMTLAMMVAAPTAALADGAVFYQGRVQTLGTLRPVWDGATAGTTGRSLYLEGVIIYGAAVEYRVHSQNIGWGPWVGADQYAGTYGRGLRAEAVQVRMAPAAYDRYHVQCRAHVQNIGWGPWVADGATCGTTGQSLRLEAVQIMLSID